MGGCDPAGRQHPALHRRSFAVLVDHVEKVRRIVDELARVPDARHHRLAPHDPLFMHSVQSIARGARQERNSELSPWEDNHIACDRLIFRGGRYLAAPACDRPGRGCCTTRVLNLPVGFKGNGRRGEGEMEKRHAVVSKDRGDLGEALRTPCSSRPLVCGA